MDGQCRLSAHPSPLGSERSHVRDSLRDCAITYAAAKPYSAPTSARLTRAWSKAKSTYDTKNMRSILP